MTAVRVFQVGGSLRDEFLGLAVSDRDWVVTGATPEQMIEAGYRPVGRDFPVFLHPDSHEEYALARTERKTAPGYRGFVFHSAPEVTLEEDLARRDFTVNAMARPAGASGTGSLVDPFGGRRDLAARLLRHVGPAFAEDPVRILRGARFAARLGFAVAPETLALMRGMVAAGEADALVAERVWQELSRGLAERDPVAMFAVLDAVGALARVAPEWTPWRADGAAMRALAQAASDGAGPTLRFAVACRELESAALESLCERLRVPLECRDLARLLGREYATLVSAAGLDASALAALFVRADVLRAPARFGELVAAARVCGHVDGLDFAAGAARLAVAEAAFRGVDAGAVARACATPAEIPATVLAARARAIEVALEG